METSILSNYIEANLGIFSCVSLAKSCFALVDRYINVIMTNEKRIYFNNWLRHRLGKPLA